MAPIIARGPLNLRARNEIFNVGADVPYTATGLLELLGTDEDSRSKPMVFRQGGMIGL